MATERIAKIRKAFLGWEDHGIFTCQLDLDYGGAGQGAGGYALDERPDGDDYHRGGTAFGMDWIMSVMRVCDAREWSQVEGTTVIALINDGRVWGLQPLPTEKGEAFHFNQLASRYREEAESVAS